MRRNLIKIATQAAEIVANYEPGLVAFDNAKVILEEMAEMTQGLHPNDAAVLMETVQPALDRIASMESQYGGRTL